VVGGAPFEIEAPPMSSARRGPMIQAPGSRMGPTMGSRMGPVPGSRMGPNNMIVNDTSGPVRPMSSINAANYNAARPGTYNKFDPLNQGGKGPAPALIKKSEMGPEPEAREMEKKINALIEESAMATMKGDSRLALEKAKEALKKDRQLAKHREQNNIMDGLNLELSYAVYFNLANW
jgi:hypothetical protein